jgi:cytochrome P450
MSPAFHRNNLKSFVETTNKFAELLIQQMLRWEDNSIQNTLPFTMKTALSIIFGKLCLHREK